MNFSLVSKLMLAAAGVGIGLRVWEWHKNKNNHYYNINDSDDLCDLMDSLNDEQAEVVWNFAYEHGVEPFDALKTLYNQTIK